MSATLSVPAATGRGTACAVLAAGVLVAATSSILIRWAQQAGMPSLLIAAGRMGFAVLLLTPLVWARAGRELRALPGRDWGIAAVAGLFLAAHFGTWISSLQYTSVASSAALVTTNPIWVGLASVLLLRERLPRAAVLGIGLSLAGSLVILLADADAAGAPSPAPLLGNLLALAGAVTVSGYFLTGRVLKGRVSLLAYVWIAYGTAALALLAAAVTAGDLPSLASLSDWPSVAWWSVLGLALGPQLLGHTAFNWSLRRLSATFVAVSILGEPIGSALFAWLLFGETMSIGQLAGFALLLAGIVTASRGA